MGERAWGLALKRPVARRLDPRVVRDDSDDWMPMRWRCSPQEQPLSTVGVSQLTIHCILPCSRVGQTEAKSKIGKPRSTTCGARGP